MTALGQQGSSCWEVSWPKLGNFYLDLTIKMPETCDANDRFGLLFRAPENNAGYLYGITCGGVQTFTAWTGTETLQILPAAQSDLILTAPGALNRVGVMAQDSSFAFYINGVLVAEGLDQTFLEEGKIGLYVNTATTDGFTVGYAPSPSGTCPGRKRRPKHDPRHGARRGTVGNLCTSYPLTRDIPTFIPHHQDLHPIFWANSIASERRPRDDDAHARVGGQHPLEPSRRLGRAVRHDDLPGVDAVADAHPAPVVQAHPGRAAHGVDQRVEQRPVRDGV
jgi:hypothetical protein